MLLEKSLLDIMSPKLYAINYLQCQKGFRTKERIPIMPYFLYVHKGTGFFIIGETKHKCSAGDLFFCPYHLPNTIIADNDDPFLLSGVDFEFCENTPDFIAPFEFKEHIHVHNNQAFFWLTMELIKRNAAIDKSYFEYTQTLFCAWLLLIANLSNSNQNLSLAENIASFLATNISRNISLAQIAEEFKYHPNHINRIFKNRFGTTLKKYHDDLRIKEAMQLLSYSNYSIGEISNICGYEDFNYFSRVFKQKTSLSPSQYRNRL
jgi:AraC-like DNA-binding protein